MRKSKKDPRIMTIRDLLGHLQTNDFTFLKQSVLRAHQPR